MVYPVGSSRPKLDPLLVLRTISVAEKFQATRQLTVLHHVPGLPEPSDPSPPEENCFLIPYSTRLIYNVPPIYSHERFALIPTSKLPIAQAATKSAYTAPKITKGLRKPASNG